MHSPSSPARRRQTLEERVEAAASRVWEAAHSSPSGVPTPDRLSSSRYLSPVAQRPRSSSALTREVAATPDVREPDARDSEIARLKKLLAQRDSEVQQLTIEVTRVTTALRAAEEDVGARDKEIERER